jgi:putative FmdB family regulatory protein
LPLYEYQCGRCGRFEIIQKFSDAPLTVCPTCGQEVQKLLSAPAIQFKGTGWYITDYARKSSGGSDASSKDAGKTAAAGDPGSKDKGSSGDKGSTDKGSSDKGSSGTPTSPGETSTAKAAKS